MSSWIGPRDFGYHDLCPLFSTVPTKLKDTGDELSTVIPDSDPQDGGPQDHTQTVGEVAGGTQQSVFLLDVCPGWSKTASGGFHSSGISKVSSSTQPPISGMLNWDC